MSIKSIFVVLLAIICGVSAAVGVSQLRTSNAPTQSAAAPETSPVAVAAVAIPRGKMVAASDLAIRQWPKDMLPEGAIATVEEAVDRAVAIPILAGEPVLSAKLASKDAGRGLAALVPKGMRAYTVQTSRVASSVAGFVLPGNKVDILLNLRGTQNDDTGGGSTTTLLQAVEILAVDQRLDAPTDNKVNPKDLSSVTLLVTPDQAAMLDLGQSLGQLTLSLRNPEDGGQAVTRPATLADIRFHEEKPAAAPPPAAPVVPAVAIADEPEVYTIMTLRGNRSGLVSITARR